MESAAGGTSQRLNPGLAIEWLRSRKESAPMALGPRLCEVTVACRELQHRADPRRGWADQRRLAGRLPLYQIVLRYINQILIALRYDEGGGHEAERGTGHQIRPGAFFRFAGTNSGKQILWVHCFRESSKL